ncbi:hypothetical protein DOY81_005870 [Sarcophaga bullata]|nr:hypothetical protein DOY81_005870 [Sarcophaga bullata]
MLPPPIATPTTTTTMNISQHKPELDNTQQSSYLLNNSTIIKTTTNTTARLKNFFHKTLAKANFNNNSSASITTALSSSSSSLPTAADVLATQVYDGLITASIAGEAGGGVSMAVNSLTNTTTHHLETTTAAAAFPTAQTVATIIAAGNKNRATTIIVYPTVSPESIVIPIVSCIFGFPILAFIVICCLRHRAKLARERDRRRNYDMQDHAVSLVRFSPIHRLNYRSSRAISLRPERSLSQGFTSLELDTVVEERCSDVEQTQTEILQPESPMESTTTSYKMSFSSS